MGSRHNLDYIDYIYNIDLQFIEKSDQYVPIYSLTTRR